MIPGCNLEGVIVVDGFLQNADEIRAMALAADYIDWAAPDGETYKRICITEIPFVRDGIEKILGPVEMLGMGFRLNYGGEAPNCAIHSDLGWGTHALVLYLSEGEGGTAFWRHKETGAERIEPGDMALFDKLHGDWDSVEAWERVGLCEIRLNRAVIYESALFHSRWPFEAFGTGPDDGRLIAVAFFTPKECR